MKACKISSFISIIFYLGINYNSLFASQQSNATKPIITLKYVFTSQVDSTNKDVLKLYDDNTYEYLFFLVDKNKPKVKREKGTYRFNDNKLVLKMSSKKPVKDHPCRFLFIENKGLAKTQRLNFSKKEIQMLYVLTTDSVFWLPTYRDNVFGNITNDKKAVRKIIEDKPEYKLVASTPNNTVIDEVRENVINETVILHNKFLSKDSLKKLKAVFIVGPVEEATKEFIDEQKKNAAYLKSLGIQVIEFYHPNAKQKDIVALGQGANILVYAGHGGVSVYCLTNGVVNSIDLLKDLKLKNNALIIFNHACESAGSSALDKTDIGLTDAFTRVTEYAKPFLEHNASAYYANNYYDCLIPFFKDFFERNKLKNIYTNQAAKWSKLEKDIKYKYNSLYEVGIASNKGSNDIQTLTWYNEKNKIEKVEKFKNPKTYNVAFIGNPNFTVIDFFK